MCTCLSFLLIAADPSSKEWDQIIATVQRNLAWLSLNNNEIAIVPHSIAQLRSLKALWIYGVTRVIAAVHAACANLAGNKIEKLPDSIGDLANMQFLDLFSMC